MSSYEYHQILQFLYFEGYADSYESAEYLFEQLSDEEFEELNEAWSSKKIERFNKEIKRQEQQRKRTPNSSLRPGDQAALARMLARGQSPTKSASKPDPTPTEKPKRTRTIKKTELASIVKEDFDIISNFLFVEGFTDTIENAELMAESISEQWANQILDEAHLILEKPYQIYGPDPHGSSDSESRPLGKPYKNKKRAKTRADRLDDEIGGYRHSVRKVDEEYKDLTPEKEEKVKNRVGELARDIQVQGERMKDLKKKPFGKYRPKVKQEKEAILKSARKKQKLVQNASDALIRTSTSRSASIQKRIQDLKDRS